MTMTVHHPKWPWQRFPLCSTREWKITYRRYTVMLPARVFACVPLQGIWLPCLSLLDAYRWPFCVANALTPTQRSSVTLLKLSESTICQGAGCPSAASLPPANRKGDTLWYALTYTRFQPLLPDFSFPFFLFFDTKAAINEKHVGPCKSQQPVLWAHPPCFSLFHRYSVVSEALLSLHKPIQYRSEYLISR